jgi:hypothetical protein
LGKKATVWLLFLMTFLLGVSCALPETMKTADFGVWERFEAEVANPRSYADPYRDVRLDVVYTKPNGQEVSFWGFHDGGYTWKTRFMPDQTGVWRYRAVFSDGAPFEPRTEETGSSTSLAQRAHRRLRVVRGSDILTAYYNDATMPGMRTTVTLDPDVERLLKEEVHRTRLSFKAVLNNAVRAGLRTASQPDRRRPFVVRAQPMGVRPGIDPARLGEVADELEIEAFLTNTERLREQIK